MPSPTLLVARRILLALAFAVPFAAVQAQPAPAGASTPPAPLQNQEQQADGRRNQKVEHIHTEDSGASVDEVRYGGRTQSINVKPKANVPGYEVRPNDPGARTGSGDANSNGNGARVWNVMKF
jgi:starvation-inducible outer membrane lipoprotein